MLLLLILAKIIIPFFILLNMLPLLIWLERKGAAYIQDRRGPNRASLFGVIRLGGLIHAITDVIKLVNKEDITPSNANKFFYYLAPFIAMSVACVTFAVLPFADSIRWNGAWITFQAADLNAGILYVLSISSIGIFGIMLGAWSSNSKYTLLGGLRSSAQMISYEIVMSMAIISVLMMAGSLELSKVVENQGSIPLQVSLLDHFPYLHLQGWNFIRQPIACLFFIVAMFAEANRLPFDLPEGESELVAGYHTEYSSLKFALFFMAEYVNMTIASGVLATLFFGGWQIPFMSSAYIRENASMILTLVLAVLAITHVLGGAVLLKKGIKNIRIRKWGNGWDYEPAVIGTAALGLGLLLSALLYFLYPISLTENGGLILQVVLQALTFLAKILFFCWVFIWVRWTLPRFRYDQLMNLGWKKMLPISLLNILVTGVCLLAI
ncbi:MAG: NADH-quinone oxidoreductase subunit H [Deltaproteobacteria bacterium]|nr:NADH-quinone oxidoreductase subunit H [Deltaproteobacteria bacterium]